MHAVQETIYFSEESTEDNPGWIFDPAFAWTSEDSIQGEREPNKDENERAEGRDTACSFRHNLGSMFI